MAWRCDAKVTLTMIAKKDVEATDMKGYAIVHGRKISFELSKGLAAAHRRNARQSLSAAEAITKVEERRRVRAIKHASPYVEARR